VKSQTEIELKFLVPAAVRAQLAAKMARGSAMLEVLGCWYSDGISASGYGHPGRAACRIGVPLRSVSPKVAHRGLPIGESPETGLEAATACNSNDDNADREHRPDGKLRDGSRIHAAGQGGMRRAFGSGNTEVGRVEEACAPIRRQESPGRSRLRLGPSASR